MSNRLYLYEMGQNREREAIKRFLQGPAVVTNNIFSMLGIPFPYCWLGINIGKSKFLKSSKQKDFPGDIDLCGGPLSFDSHENGHHWPPDITWMGAMEIKTHWMCADRKLKSTKAGRWQKNREQALNLAHMGFNKVCLLHIVATEPRNSTQFHPWFDALEQSTYAFELFRDKVLLPELKKLKKTDPIGYAVWGWGAVGVEGKTEDYAGAGAPQIVKNAPDNVVNGNHMAVRNEFMRQITLLLGNAPQPTAFPVFILQCSHCQKLFVENGKYFDLCHTCRIRKRGKKIIEGKVE